MKQILNTRYVVIPEGVTVVIKARVVTVTGPRGTLTRTFKHRALEITRVDGGKKLRVDIWFGLKKQLAALRTCCSHMQNMITGVTKGFRYSVRAVYAHFPINCVIESPHVVEIRNFLGEKRVRRVNMREGVTVRKHAETKDCLIVEGNDIELVGNSVSLISGVSKVKNKDIRKFLDGMYVEKKGPIEDEM